MEQIKKIIKFILDNCDKNQKEKLFEIIKMRIDDEIRYDIFISIIDDKHLSSFIDDKHLSSIIDYLLNNKKKDLFDIIKNIGREKVLLEIFKKLIKYNLTEDDLFSKERTEKLDFFMNLYSNNYFNNEDNYLHNLQYFKKTSVTLNSIRQKIEELHLKENELNKLMDIENEELLERLTFIFENNQNKANHMKKKLTNTKETIKTIRNNIFFVLITN